jgi:hypothetical protein
MILISKLLGRFEIVENEAIQHHRDFYGTRNHPRRTFLSDPKKL